MEALLLRFDAPLMSFGGVLVDNQGGTMPFPGRSLLTGLLGNALGYRHGDAQELQGLQSRLRHAVRCDRPGRLLLDYQTVDLSQDFLTEGWTTRGATEDREGGNKDGTHIRYRQYWADAVYTIAVTLEPSVPAPTLAELGEALVHPARPLFLGRKTCLPAVPLLISTTTGFSLREILERAPDARAERSTPPPWRAWWPLEEDSTAPVASRVAVYDERDWKNQVHTGRRWLVEGTLGE